MRAASVAIVGAGPAGLYLAILLKRDDPSRRVTVVERNPPDATYGWGVVFSEETLSELRDADYETFVAVDDALVRWSAIDIRYRGRTVRSRGHGFSAIRRTTLLRLLQERAAAHGVELVFEDEVTGTDRFADRDVIVGADGVNSTVRSQRDVGTTLTEHASRYVWFGTDHVFEVFTFIFEETEHGLFTVHAYPFDADASTFIVECSDETWRAAGLDRMSEADSVTFCERLFADHLQGGRLLSNRSLWTRFVTVRNRRWHDGNVVLIGDAAHTAHFSIGSGTKLAMEDSIALAKAFVANDRLADVFAEYELERQTKVERFQEAASDSARYFETVSRFVGFDHEQFAFNLLTRSGRITRGNLEQRDPVIVNATDRWMHAHATGEAARVARIASPPPLHAPLHLGTTVVANRLAQVCRPLDVAEDGRVSGRHTEAVATAAGTGAGLVVTEAIAVSPHGRTTPGTPGLWGDEHANAWRDVLDAVRTPSVGEASIRFAARITHAGRRGATRPRARGLDRPLHAGGWTLLAPSPIAYTARSAVPEPLDARTRRVVIEDFAAAAERAAAASFDVLVLDVSDGYLLASFLSPLTNRRDDELGGDLEARLRFPLEVLDAVGETWPRDRPLAVRLNADDRRPGGFGPEEATHVARELVARGVALIDVVSGHTIPDGTAAPDYRRGFLVDLATAVRTGADVPTVTSGGITTLDEVDTIVAAGRADLVAVDLGRYERSVVTEARRDRRNP